MLVWKCQMYQRHSIASCIHCCGLLFWKHNGRSFSRFVHTERRQRQRKLHNFAVMNGLYANILDCSHGDRWQRQRQVVSDGIVGVWVGDPFLAATATEKLPFVWVFGNFRTFLKCRLLLYSAKFINKYGFTPIQKTC